jgi:two-component system, LytTR family, sensor kinase
MLMSHSDPYASKAALPRRTGLSDARFAKSLPGIAQGRIRAAILIVLGWTAVGLFWAMAEVLRGFQWPLFVSKPLDAWAWALLTPAILLIDRRLSSVRQNFVRLAAIHFLLSMPFAVVHACIAGLLFYPIPGIWWNPLRNTEFAVYFFLGGVGTYWSFVGSVQAFKYYNSFLTSEKKLIESQLNALRLHLEPHFLFNALNAISSELAANPRMAREMIEDLGALLRRSLECQGSTEITLAQELALLDHYLAIQRRRFGERLDIRIEVEPAMLSALVPSMLLQPLIENAIRHGIEARSLDGGIAVTARRAGDKLEIQVVDDGVGLPPAWCMEDSAGVGLRVTEERLEALYSRVGGHDFTVCPRKGKGTEVTVRIPLHKDGDENRAIAA